MKMLFRQIQWLMKRRRKKSTKSQNKNDLVKITRNGKGAIIEKRQIKATDNQSINNWSILQIYTHLTLLRTMPTLEFLLHHTTLPIWCLLSISRQICQLVPYTLMPINHTCRLTCFRIIRMEGFHHLWCLSNILEALIQILEEHIQV